jgi:CBS domain-containing protein
MTNIRSNMTKRRGIPEDDGHGRRRGEAIRQADISAAPICGPDGHLAGNITDRDIVVKVALGERALRKVLIGDIADQGEVVTIGADDAAEEALEMMKRPVTSRLHRRATSSQRSAAEPLPFRSERHRFFTACGKSRKWS